jgi:hypothetical protein
MVLLRELTDQVRKQELEQKRHVVCHIVTINTNQVHSAGSEECLRDCIDMIAARGSSLLIDEEGHPEMLQVDYKLEVGPKVKRAHAHLLIQSEGEGKVRFDLKKLREVCDRNGCPYMNCRWLKPTLTQAQIVERYITKSDRKNQALSSGVKVAASSVAGGVESGEGLVQQLSGLSLASATSSSDPKVSASLGSGSGGGEGSGSSTSMASETMLPSSSRVGGTYGSKSSKRKHLKVSRART